MDSTLVKQKLGSTLVLDGGFGTHLEQRGNDITGQLWSAAILRDHPAEVAAAHRDFFAAGADVAITCSYQVTFEALGEEAEALLRRSVDLAREAAEGECLVAASIGPYGAGPGQGTDYDGEYGIGRDALEAWHAKRISVLADTSADFLLAETIPNIEEVAALLKLLDRSGKPYALSITGVLAADPAAVEEVIALVQQAQHICAVGVNCCSAEVALRVVEQFREGLDLPIIAYPNSGETWDHEARTWVRETANSLGLVEAVPLLQAAGANIIGGCCRTTPEQIREARTLLVK